MTLTGQGERGTTKRCAAAFPFHRLGMLFVACAAWSCGGQAASDKPSDPSSSGGSGGGNATKAGGAGQTASQAGGGGASLPTGGASAGAGIGGESAGGFAPVPTKSSVVLRGVPFYSRALRLTNSQWQHAVTDVLRLTDPPDLSVDFEAPRLGTDFTNNEQVLNVTGRLAQSYETGAEAAAALATGSEAALAALYEGTDPEGFVRELGWRAFRRPLSADEEQKYLGVFNQGEVLYGAGFANGAALVIRALLQSPHFLYRTELGPAGDALDGLELASKLSFWLLGTTPSDELLEAAAAGRLGSEQELEDAARQMLDEAAATRVMRDFHGQLFHFARYAEITKVGVPDYTPELNSELEQASYLFFDRVFEQNLGFRDVLTSSTGYVGPAMAALYRLTAPASGFEVRDLGPMRRGFFMQLPFLISHSVNAEPSPIHRGLTLHLDVLCGALEAPVGEVPTLPPPIAGQTNRQRVTQLTAGCGGDCHNAFIDPLGFAFENFDGMGRERSTDNRLTVDASGVYPFSDGTHSFTNALELMGIMADSAQPHTCYAKKLASYALQRDMIEPDRPLLEALAQVSSDHSLKEMVIALVKDPAFRLRPASAP